MGPDWLWHPLGACGALPHSQAVACKSYNWWSGIEPDIPEVVMLITAIVAIWRGYRFLRTHYECHAEDCHRWGIHHVKGTHYRTCWDDHPVLGQHPHHKVPLALIHQAHADANERTP